MSDPILDAAMTYGAARLAQLTARRRFWGLRCEWRDEDTPPCWMLDEPRVQCDQCLTRGPLYPAWREALKAEKVALRKLQRVLLRDGRRAT